MNEIEVLIHDGEADRSWSVAACSDGIAWLTSTTEPGVRKTDLEYATTALYEVQLTTGKRREVRPCQQPFYLFNLTVSQRYLYMAIVTDTNDDGHLTSDDFLGGHRLVRMDRASGEVQQIWSTAGVWQQILDLQVLDDTWCLLLVAFRDEQGEVWQRYDLLHVEKGNVKTIYVDNEEWMEARAFLTQGPNGPLVVLDRHVLPSDKPLSGGQPDRITVFG